MNRPAQTLDAAWSSQLFRVLAVALLIVASPSGAEEYPVRPIRIVVPYPPGAFNDQLARLLAQRLHQSWGQPVVVDNRPGGGSLIGTELVARAAADGYTLLINSFAFAVNPSLQPKLPYDSEHDFAPVILAATTPNMLVVNPGLPVKSVAELIALAKAKPGALSYASAGNGASNHLCMELLKRMSGIDLVHIPYKGSVPAVTDLLGGQVNVMFDNMPNIAQQVLAGKLRAIGVTSAKRSAMVPELPTIAETVHSFEVTVWFGVMAPAATPAEIVRKLNLEINRILKSPEVIAQFARQGVETAGGTSEQFSTFLRAQTSKWAKVVKDAGIRLE